MNLGLAGRVCVVTGGSRGIGAATAELLSQEGASVVTVARTDADIEIDVTSAHAADDILAACSGVPWALVNSAGAAYVRSLEELSDSDWQDQWELHVMAPLRLMRVIGPRMEDAGGGRIVNVCSSSALRPSGTLDAAYSVTKAAELALSNAFSRAFDGTGVSVYAITPGPVLTELWAADGGLADQIAAREGTTRDEVLRATHRRSPTGRMLTPEQIAAEIAVLCAATAASQSLSTA